MAHGRRELGWECWCVSSGDAAVTTAFPSSTPRAQYVLAMFSMSIFSTAGVVLFTTPPTPDITAPKLARCDNLARWPGMRPRLPLLSRSDPMLPEELALFASLAKREDGARFGSACEEAAKELAVNAVKLATDVPKSASALRSVRLPRLVPQGADKELSATRDRPLVL